MPLSQAAAAYVKQYAYDSAPIPCAVCTQRAADQAELQEMGERLYRRDAANIQQLKALVERPSPESRPRGPAPQRNHPSATGNGDLLRELDVAHGDIEALYQQMQTNQARRALWYKTSVVNGIFKAPAH